MSLEAYKDIQNNLNEFLSLSKQLGGDVATQAKLVEEAFKAQYEYLTIATQRSKPSDTEQASLLQPLSQKIQAIQGIREKNRASDRFNHLSGISESIPALGWVTVSPAPAPFVKEMKDAGQFYMNRVLMEFKEKDQKHLAWVRSWTTVLEDLQKFVKQYHTTGLVWSGKGGAPPPPPPIGNLPPPPLMINLGEFDGGSDDRSALFAEINQGENITRALKKVTPDMQTHKNSNLRTGPAPFKAPAASGTNAVRPVVAKPPVFNRDGKKWIIEHYKDNHGLLVDKTEMNNVVYMFGCTNCTLTVKGKINSIFLDSCRKSSVVFDSVVSSAEFVNCQSVQMQVLGKVPTISIDKTDGCQMYLNDHSLDVEIVSSKSSEMNVLIPKGSGDYIEYPIAEQFKTRVSPSGLKTTVVESKG